MITHLKDRFNDEELKDALESMLSEIGWNSLREIVKSNKKFFSRFTAGGFQLRAQNIHRARNTILQATEKEDYERLFLFWRQEKDDLRSFLDTWSETNVSGDEKDTEESKECQEMSTETFENLIGFIKNRDGLYLLCFSPVVFTHDQESRLLKTVSGEDNGIHVPEETSQQEIRTEKIIYETKVEIKKLKAQLRKVQHDNRRLIKECGFLEEKSKENDFKLENGREMVRHYEEQIARLGNLENTRIVQLENRNAEQMKKLEGMQGILDRLHDELRQKESDTNRLKEEKAFIEEKFKSKIGDVLREFNLSEIIRSLNEPDEVKELLQSIVRITSFDETDKSLRKHTDIMEFWYKLIESESASIKIVEEITLESASERDFSDKWADLSDRLVDLRYSLRARGVIIGFFYEILRKFYVFNESLPEEPSFPKPMSAAELHKQNIFAEQVEILGLEPKILKSIRSKNIFTVADLVRKKDNELFRIKNFGKKDLEKLKKTLSDNGLCLGMTVPDYL